MSINNYIKDLLNIKDRNIVIDTENIIVKKVKYIDTKFIYGKLTYTPEICPCCGHVNESFNIIKYGNKTCKVKLPNISNDIKRKIAVDLTKISSFKSIAESNVVSPNTILRVFKEWNKSFKQDFSYLQAMIPIDTHRVQVRNLVHG